MYEFLGVKFKRTSRSLSQRNLNNRIHDLEKKLDSITKKTGTINNQPVADGLGWGAHSPNHEKSSVGAYCSPRAVLSCDALAHLSNCSFCRGVACDDVIVLLSAQDCDAVSLAGTVASLVDQSVKPRKIIILSDLDVFDNSIIINFFNKGLCEQKKTSKSILKILQTIIQEFPGCSIITAKVGLVYPDNWLEILRNGCKIHEGEVIAHNCSRVAVYNNQLTDSKYWVRGIRDGSASFYNYPVYGAFYPSDICNHIVLQNDLLNDVAYSNVDVTLWLACIANDVKTRALCVDLPVLKNISDEVSDDISGIKVPDWLLEKFAHEYAHVEVVNHEDYPNTSASMLVRNSIPHQPLVSIIVPVYKVEQYLRQCLDSIINQTMANFEVICVDDSSPDCSREILLSYALRDSRITILSQANAGGATARNAGIAVARGKYMLFLDSDDYVEHDLLQTCCEIIEKENSDVLFFQAQKFDNETGKPIGIPHCIFKKSPDDSLYNTYSREELQAEIFSIASAEPWNKLMRTSLIKQKGIVFQGSLVDDTYFSYMVHVNASRITLLYKPMLHYRCNREGQQSGSMDKAPCAFSNAMLSVYRQLKSYLNETPATYINFLETYIMSTLWAFRNAALRKDEVKREFLTTCSRVLHVDSFKDKLSPSAQNVIARMEGPPVIVSIMARKKDLDSSISSVIKSLYQQFYAPDYVVLNLCADDYKDGVESVPEEIRSLEKIGLQIFMHENAKSINRYSEVLKVYPDAVIVSANTDQVYPMVWMGRLINSLYDNPAYVHANSIMRVQIQQGGVAISNGAYPIALQPMLSWIPDPAAGAIFPSRVLTNMECRAYSSPEEEAVAVWSYLVQNKVKSVRAKIAERFGQNLSTVKGITPLVEKQVRNTPLIMDLLNGDIPHAHI